MGNIVRGGKEISPGGDSGRLWSLQQASNEHVFKSLQQAYVYCEPVLKYLNQASVYFEPLLEYLKVLSKHTFILNPS